ncbi:MerR family transcriptional regulator [Flavobacterium beibuense]|uniref:TipAS antibiotic-recognition domain protein n=1 Tax=Flavobacterium beibuense TaxID=657326 RepID=A0A444WIR0_9FLAO|nr:MerR family transcriptional regulator [Flavobacterium beibuense]RYJ45675.1 TipAS antibiotic-recognition domain protein [Flavobacterium beibuense]
MEKKYTVKQLAEIAGVSVRTLHLYDSMGLLSPLVRSEANYRLYGTKELLRLQQILFYRELDIPLKEIALLLDDPDFDELQSLKAHREMLISKKERLLILLETIDKTIDSLKNKTMLKPEELYEGLSPEKAAAYKKEAVKKYGEEVVDKAQSHLQNLKKNELQKLVEEQKELAVQLYQYKNQSPMSNTVQLLIRRHYENTRKLWGTSQAKDTQAEAYKGLGLLYLNDERFTLVNNVYDEEFARFLSQAMEYFSDNNL